MATMKRPESGQFASLGISDYTHQQSAATKKSLYAKGAVEQERWLLRDQAQAHAQRLNLLPHIAERCTFLDVDGHLCECPVPQTVAEAEALIETAGGRIALQASDQPPYLIMRMHLSGALICILRDGQLIYTPAPPMPADALRLIKSYSGSLRIRAELRARQPFELLVRQGLVDRSEESEKQIRYWIPRAPIIRREDERFLTPKRWSTTYPQLDHAPIAEANAEAPEKSAPAEYTLTVCIQPATCEWLLAQGKPAAIAAQFLDQRANETEEYLVQGLSAGSISLELTINAPTYVWLSRHDPAQPERFAGRVLDLHAATERQQQEPNLLADLLEREIG